MSTAAAEIFARCRLSSRIAFGNPVCAEQGFGSAPSVDSQLGAATELLRCARLTQSVLEAPISGDPRSLANSCAGVGDRDAFASKIRNDKPEIMGIPPVHNALRM